MQFEVYECCQRKKYIVANYNKTSCLHNLICSSVKLSKYYNI